MTQWAALPPAKYKKNDVVEYSGRNWEVKDASYDHSAQDWNYQLKSGLRTASVHERELTLVKRAK